MAKKTMKKLSVKKETLRTLGGAELRKVAGGLLEVNKLALQQPILIDPLKLDSSDVCQSGIVGSRSFTCILVATRCYEP
jgi:hypothetical protein